MWKGISKFLFLSLTISRIRGHLAWDGSPLHPVQGLYVKPSGDGTTGDLYVAATEDHGIDVHWLTDQPVNFLPATASTETKPTKVPVSFTSSFSKTSSPNEETVTTQKRAVITSPQFKYTYALPSAEGTPYPYFAVPRVSASKESNPPCSSDGAPAMSSYPQFSPYHYFYPQIMAAMTNAMTARNDDGGDKGSTSSQVPPYWPHGYSYPYGGYPYLMVDPAAWLQGQASTSAGTTPATTSSDK